jgi:hypothetical protein
MVECVLSLVNGSVIALLITFFRFLYIFFGFVELWAKNLLSIDTGQWGSEECVKPNVQLRHVQLQRSVCLQGKTKLLAKLHTVSFVSDLSARWVCLRNPEWAGLSSWLCQMSSVLPAGHPTSTPLVSCGHWDLTARANMMSSLYTWAVVRHGLHMQTSSGEILHSSLAS